MRCLVICLGGLLVSACTDTSDVPVTVVHVNVTSSCASCDPAVFPDSFCGYDVPQIDPDTRHAEIYTVLQPGEVAGLVQHQYTGWGAYDDAPWFTDAILRDVEHTEVLAVGDGQLLYHVDPQGHVSDLETSRLASASGTELHFAYTTSEGASVTEDHVIDPPRMVNIEATSPPPCCSAGKPQDLGIVFALVFLRRRRRLRRCSRSRSME